MYLLDMDHSYLGPDSPLVALKHIRDSFNMAIGYLNDDMYYCDKTIQAIAGGVVFGLELSASGNDITVSSGVAIINDVVIEASDFSIGVSDNSSGYILLCYTQQGGYKYYCGPLSGVPDTYAYIVLATYVSSSGSVTFSYTERDDAVTMYNSSISGSLSRDLEPYETLITTVDHSAIASFPIPGYITVSVDSYFYHAYYYTGQFWVGVYGQENVTPTSFQVEIINNKAWPAHATVTWTRTGIMNANPVK